MCRVTINGWGVVWNHRLGCAAVIGQRSDDAKGVRTSPVVLRDGDTIITKSGSRYKLGSCNPLRTRKEWLLQLDEAIEAINASQ